MEIPSKKQCKYPLFKISSNHYIYIYISPFTRDCRGKQTRKTKTFCFYLFIFWVVKHLCSLPPLGGGQQKEIGRFLRQMCLPNAGKKKQPSSSPPPRFSIEPSRPIFRSPRTTVPRLMSGSTETALRSTNFPLRGMPR